MSLQHERCATGAGGHEQPRPAAPVIRLCGTGLPDAGSLQDLLGDTCLVIGARDRAEVVVLGSPSPAEVRLTRAEQPAASLLVLLRQDDDDTCLVAAYDAGADLVVRDVESRELAARVRSLLRRRRRLG